MYDEMLRAALDYAGRGWRIFPLHNITATGACSCRTKCKSPGKHPRIRKWEVDATSDISQIEEWWTDWPMANIGLATGKDSGIWVLDIDNARSVDIGAGSLVPEGEHSIRVLVGEYGDLPRTLSQRTGSGGTHHFFRYPEEGEHRNRAGLAPSVDVRGEGGYVVLPPSNHASGHLYRWIDDEAPVASVPEWLLTLARRERSPIALESGEKVGKGQRNAHLFRVGSYWRGKGAEYPEILGILMVANQNDLDPPLDAEEVRQIARNAAAQDINVDEPIIRLPSEAVGGAVDELRGVSGVDEEDEEPALSPGDDLAWSLFDLTTKNLDPPLPLVHNLIDGGTGILLAGPPNVGKSWIALQMGLAIATGGKFLDQFETERAPVLVIDEEGSEWGDQQRMAMLMEGHGIGSASDIPLFFAIGRQYKLDSRKGVTAVRRMIERYEPGLVIVDSLIRVHSGDENVSRDMAKFFAVTKSLMKKTGSAFLFVHHVRKASLLDTNDPGEIIRGSSEIRAWPDIAFVVKPGSDSTEMVVHNIKQRWRQRLEPFNVRLLTSREQGWAKLGWMGEAQIEDSSAVGTQNKIVAIIHELVEEGTLTTADAIAYKLGKSTATTKDHIRRLVAAGIVVELQESGRTRTYMVRP